MDFTFFMIFFLLAVRGFFLVGVGAVDDPRRNIKQLFSYRTFQ